MENQLHAYLLEVAHALRKTFQENNSPHMTLEITIDGRPDGDLELKYSLGEYGTDVSGDSISSVKEEFMRRKKWEQRHNPICLPPA